MFFRLPKVFLPLLIFLTAAAAEARPILTIVKTQPDGSVTNIEIGRSEFLNYPMISFRTRTDYTTGDVEFSGPLVRTVLGEAALRGAAKLILTAHNDYAVEIPVSDFLRYDAILAIRADGHPLTIRDKGPIWLMYPISRHSELQNTTTNSKLIWQLAKIEMK